MSRVDRITALLGKAGKAAEDAILVLLLIGMLLLSAAQVVLRNFFDIGFFWSDELLRLMVLWVALAGSLAATRSRKHISISVLQNLSSERWGNAINALVQLFAACICVVMTRASFDFVATSREFEDLIFASLPAWWFQIPLPLVFGLMAYRFLLISITDLIAAVRNTSSDREQ